jgi:hypothetical protein
MPHPRAGAMRQNVAGARIVRLHQDRRDRPDTIDVELELFDFDGLGFDSHNQPSQQTRFRPPWYRHRRSLKTQ